jgi:hypothetical protein
MEFIARRFLIPAAFQFVVITRYYARLSLAGNKNPRTLNSIQLRFFGSITFLPANSPVAYCERI